MATILPVPTVGPDSNAARQSSVFGRVVCSRTTLTVLLLLGVGLRAWAYFGNPSLWLDEVLLSRNILELPTAALLTEPLKLDQVAPRGFLLLEKIAVRLFGESEFALRLFPFLCGIAGLLLFRRLAERVLEGPAVPFALALYAIGVPLIKYGAEVKQYGLDATVTTVLLLLAIDLHQRDASRSRLLLAGAAGLLVIWFSQASVIVMVGIGLATGITWLVSRDRRTWRMLTLTIPIWAVASVGATIAGMRSMTPSTRAFMQDFWATGFFPLPLDSPVKLAWFWDRALSLFSDPGLLRYRWPTIFLLVSLAGLGVILRRRPALGLMLTGPAVVLFAAALAQQFPFRGRLVMFLMPCLLLALAAGADWARQQVSRVHDALGWGLMASLLAVPVATVVATPPPYELEHTRSVLTFLEARRQPGDIVYVFPLTRIGLLYYGPRYGLEPYEWTTGVCDSDDTRAYILDVDRFRGSPRVWTITATVRPFRVAQAALQRYLGTIGHKRESAYFASLTMGTVAVELYDLSDPERLRAAAAQSFPVPPMPTDPRPGCRPWVRPDASGTTR